MAGYQTISGKMSFIKKCFGSTSVARDGVNIAVSCPSCDPEGRKKKLSINMDTWQYHCWVCGIKGKSIGGLIRSHLSRDLFLEYQSRFPDQKISENLPSQNISESKLVIPDDFVLFCDAISSGLRDPDILAAIRYARSRGLNERDFWLYKIGSCKRGRYRRRVIVPSFDKEGELNYFVARSIDDSRFKYLNSKVEKKNIIFNEINIDWSKEVTIVEGAFDMFKTGFNSTCLLGSSFGEDYLLFKRIISNRTPVLLALDPDATAKRERYARILSRYGCVVRTLDLPEGKDAGDLTKEEFKNLKKAAQDWSRVESIKIKIKSIQSGSII